MQFVISLDGGRDITGLDGGGEAVVGRPHGGDVVRTALRNGLPDGELVQHPHDLPGIEDIARHDIGDPRVALRLRVDEPFFGQAAQSFPNGGFREPELAGEIAVAQRSTGRQRPVDDGLADAVVRLVTQQRAGDLRETHI